MALQRRIAVYPKENTTTFLRNTVVSLAIVGAALGALGSSIPTMAKERVDRPAFGDHADAVRLPIRHPDRFAQVGAMKMSSITRARSGLVPGSDSVSTRDARQMQAIATGQYGR